jgi:hypothetical protein
MRFAALVFLGGTGVRAHQNEHTGPSNSNSAAQQRTASSADGGQKRMVGTPYVELDSWIYPAIERLAALGYIHSQFLGMRPWTRLECALAVQKPGG